MHADSRHYRNYQRMLVGLHGLIAKGAGDLTEADELHHEMEEAEAHLSEEETIRLNALSGDLSMLHNREIPDPSVVSRVLPDKLPELLMIAYMQKDWEELLALLRTDVSRFLRPEQVAYMRSRAYEALDELVPAVAFMDEAARRDPTSANFPALAMELLWSDERYDEAYCRAKDYLQDSTPNRLVLMAGGILSRRAQQDHVPADMDAIAIQGIFRMELALPNEKSPAILFSGYGALGLLAARVNDRTKAELALQHAINVPTITGKQLAARGLLLAELELIRQGQLQSTNERSMARQLADIIVPDFPDLYAIAA